MEDEGESDDEGEEMPAEAAAASPVAELPAPPLPSERRPSPEEGAALMELTSLGAASRALSALTAEVDILEPQEQNEHESHLSWSSKPCCREGAHEEAQKPMPAHGRIQPGMPSQQKAPCMSPSDLCGPTDNVQ